MDLLCTEEVNLNDSDTILNGNTNNNGQYRAFEHSSGSVSLTTSSTSTRSSTLSTASSNNQQPVAVQNVSSSGITARSDNNRQYYNVNSGSVGGNQINTAVLDPTFLADRCLENLLKTEEKYSTGCSYFKTVQRDITPPMRKIVAEWMMEVCEEEKSQEEVVLLALNYMDRFLATTSVRKTHLQILAAACLLLASKLREPSSRCLTAELLVFYTDNSISKNDLIHWELYVLSRLKWDLSSVTPLDFLELLLIRLPIKNMKCVDITLEKTRQHAQAFISLAAKEHYFTIYSASTLAASSIAAALSGLNWHLRTGIELRYLLNRLTDLTGVEQEYVRECMEKMEEIFEEHSRGLQSFLVNPLETQQQPVGSSNCNNSSSNSTNSSNTTLSVSQSTQIQEKCKVQAGTPTDVQDVKF